MARCIGNFKLEWLVFYGEMYSHGEGFMVTVMFTYRDMSWLVYVRSIHVMYFRLTMFLFGVLVAGHHMNHILGFIVPFMMYKLSDFEVIIGTEKDKNARHREKYAAANYKVKRDGNKNRKTSKFLVSQVENALPPLTHNPSIGVQSTIPSIPVRISETVPLHVKRK